MLEHSSHLSLFFFAPERARRLAAECPEIKQNQQVRAADHGLEREAATLKTDRTGESRVARCASG
jgi:hypothetical protein